MLSAEKTLGEAIGAALGSVAGLNGVFPGPPARASPPWAELGETQAADWSAVGVVGRECRTTVRLVDRRDTPAALAGLAAAASAAIAAIPRDLDGWRVASVTLLRSRTTPVKAGGWAVTLDHRVRLSAA